MTDLKQLLGERWGGVCHGPQSITGPPDKQDKTTRVPEYLKGTPSRVKPLFLLQVNDANQLLHCKELYFPRLRENKKQERKTQKQYFVILYLEQDKTPGRSIQYLYFFKGVTQNVLVITLICLRHKQQEK